MLYLLVVLSSPAQRRYDSVYDEDEELFEEAFSYGRVGAARREGRGYSAASGSSEDDEEEGVYDSEEEDELYGYDSEEEDDLYDDDYSSDEDARGRGRQPSGGRRAPRGARVQPRGARLQLFKERLTEAQGKLKNRVSGATHKGAKVIRELKVRDTFRRLRAHVFRASFSLSLCVMFYVTLR